VRIQSWRTVSAADVAASEERPDGGTYEQGTLVARGKANSFAAYLSPSVAAEVESGSLGEFVGVEVPPEPIDIVYTWVDGADPVWARKRAQWSGEIDKLPHDGAVASRYESHDELKYSLRSVEMYAGWCRHVYVITDGQVPEWMDTTSDKLTIVDHRDLFEPHELPLFNSHAIESRIHRIPGLSEEFVYLNDDMFFGRPVAPKLFFTGGGLTRFFPSAAVIDPGQRNELDNSVTSAAKNNREFLRQVFGRTLSRKMKHTPYAHRRSVLEEMELKYPEVFEASRTKFREHSNYSIVSSLAQNYSALTGRAVEGRIRYGYVDISRPDADQVYAKMLRTRSYEVFCLNDAAKYEMGADGIAAVERFLEAYYPLPSRFEKVANL